MVRVRELSENEAKRLQRIVRRGAKDIVTWRQATVVLASAQGQKVSVIAKLVQTSEDRVREMIRNFNEAGMDSLFPKWSEGRPATFTPKVRARICRIARARPAKFGLPFTTWSLDKLRDYPCRASRREDDLQGAPAPDPRRGGHHLSEDQVVEGVPRPRKGGQTRPHRGGHGVMPRPGLRLRRARALESRPDPGRVLGPRRRDPSAFRPTTTSSRGCGSSSPAITSARTSCGVE